MKILITGATGFIGSHLSERLVRDGHDVCAIVRKESDHLEGYKILEKIGVTILYGDLTDKESLRKIPGNIDAAFHLAAIARPMAIPVRNYYEVNRDGTRNFLEICKDKGIKKIVYMSSISAVGPAYDGKPVNESTKRRPVDIYGKSKLEAEKVVKSFLSEDLNIVSLRPPMVFGPRDSEMLRLFKVISKGFFPIRYSKGYMEFLYVENLVQACILAMEKGRKGQIYHITNGRSYTMKEVVKSIADARGIKIRNIRFPNWFFYLSGFFVEGFSKIFRVHPPFCRNTVFWMTRSYWYSNCSKAKRNLGYRPRYRLKDGVRKTLSYYRDKKYL